jgi:hypothetical protein
VPAQFVFHIARNVRLKIVSVNLLKTPNCEV